jgi:general secretion pathway protein M
MSMRDRIERLEPRERQLLGILATVFLGMAVLAIPLGASAVVSSRQSDNDQYRQVITAIQTGRARVRKAKAEHDALLARYARPAPPLASMLAKFAKDEQIDIPESQDRAVVPHGKQYDERSTKIVLRKVGMLHLVKFMEKIEQSHYPVLISQLNIRKRSTETDSFDVDMTVSAYDRKAPEKPTKPADDSGDQPL